MPPNRYLPPMRPLPKKNRYLEPDTTAQLPAKPTELTASPAFDLDRFLHGLLDVPPPKRRTFFSAWREVVALERNSKVAAARARLLRETEAMLKTTASIHLTYGELQHQLSAHIADLRAVETLEREVKKARLQAELAEHRKRKRLADDTEND